MPIEGALLKEPCGRQLCGRPEEWVDFGKSGEGAVSAVSVLLTMQWRGLSRTGTALFLKLRTCDGAQRAFERDHGNLSDHRCRSQDASDRLRGQRSFKNSKMLLWAQVVALDKPHKGSRGLLEQWIDLPPTLLLALPDLRPISLVRP
jgi:hypothetical protein